MKRIVILPALFVVALALNPAIGSAAALSHPFLSVGSSDYEDACGLASSSAGLYVSDYYRNAIELPGHGRIAEVGSGDGPCELGVDAAGNLYANNWHEDIVKYPAGELTTGFGQVIDAGPATGVAVNPVSGDLYVDHRTYISLYKAPVEAGEEPSAKIGIGHLGKGYGLAVSAYPTTFGNIYVADAADNTIKVFNPAASEVEPVAVMHGAATPQKGFRRLVEGTVAIDNNPTSPSYGHLFVLDEIGFGPTDHPEGAFDEFNAEGDYRAQIKGFLDAEPSGIAITPSNGDVSVTSGNSEGSRLYLFGPTAPSRRLTVTKSGAGGGTVGSSPFGIACGESCVAEYDEEEKVSLFATPDAHSDFTGWTVTGPGAEPCPGTGTCSVALLGSEEVTASFETAPEQSLEATVMGSGTVLSEPSGIACPGHCSEEFAEGHTIALIARPARHYRIAKWSGCGFQPRPDECKVLIGSSSSQVGVEFVPIPAENLSIELVGSGSGEVTSYPAGISCPGTCTQSFDQGSTVYLLASSDPNSMFVGWSGAGCAGTGACAVTMNEAKSLRAEFAPPLNSASSGSSAASLSVRGLKRRGEVVILTASVPGAGTLAVTGRGLGRTETKAFAARTLRVCLRPDRSARRRLARRKELSTVVRLTFMPLRGQGPLRAHRIVVFRAAR